MERPTILLAVAEGGDAYVDDLTKAGFEPVSVDPSHVQNVPAESSEPPPPSPESFLDAGAAARRSFFAQPEPLKWTAGAEIALRTGPPPHSGHDVGPGTWTPWTTSKRRRQVAHS